jgi:DNA-binding NtrC family response regulator
VHRYDVVVCDLRMPDQSGPAIFEATKTRSPRQAARFIFTTGGSLGDADDEIHQRAAATGRPILEKPFDGASFEALVARVASEKEAS